MDVSDLPDWAGPLVVPGLVLGVMTLGSWTFRRLSKPGQGEVLGAPLIVGLAAVSLVWAVIILLVGLESADLSVPSEMASWLGLMLVPTAGAALVGWTQFGVLTRFDDEGVSVRRFSGRIEQISWTEFRNVRSGGAMWSGPVFERAQGRAFLLSSASIGAENLMLQARKANVPGIEMFYTQPPDTSAAP